MFEATITLRVQRLVDYVVWKNIRHLKIDAGFRILRLRSSPLLFYRSTGSIDIHVPRTWEKPFHVAGLFPLFFFHGTFTRFNPRRWFCLFRRRPLVPAAIMAKDKSFHSAAIIVDATVDIADIAVSWRGLSVAGKEALPPDWTSTKSIWLREFPKQRQTSISSVYSLVAGLLSPSLSFQELYVANFEAPFAGPFVLLSYYHHCDINLGIFPRSLRRALASANISVVGLAIILLPIINLNARCHTSIAMKAWIYTGNKISLIERINVILHWRTEGV